MKTFIIAIAGHRNSGKDTVANMIDYIFKTGITKANYKDWIFYEKSFDAVNSDRIIHFADSLKDVLSIIYNISRDKFDDREYKDNYYFNIKTGKFTKEDVVNTSADAEIVTIEDLKSVSLKLILDCAGDKFVYIKLRTLLQYFGTNICRHYLDDKIWIRNTMSKAVDIAEARRVCIISDLRFKNELEALPKDNEFLYGVSIMLSRKRDNVDNHESEKFDFECDFNIDNNKTKAVLFYKVLDICQRII